jgi:short-subunit dehydrogenase
MLAARMFGLGPTWTSFHLFYEQEAANIFNIPYQQIMQATLIPAFGALSVYSATKSAIRSFARALNSLDLSAFNKNITGFI